MAAPCTSWELNAVKKSDFSIEISGYQSVHLCWYSIPVFTAFCVLSALDVKSSLAEHSMNLFFL